MADIRPEAATPAYGAQDFAARQRQLLTDTYRLLAMTLLFSAAMALVAITLRVPPLGLWMLAPYFVLLFIVQANARKPSGILWTFAFTGWLGFSMGPIIDLYVAANGSAIVANALSATGLTFLAASWAGRAMPGMMSRIFFPAVMAILIAFVVGLLNVLIFQSTALDAAISGIFAVLATLLIAGTTARIVRGEETSYVEATVTLFVMLWNLFLFFLRFFNNRN